MRKVDGSERTDGVVECGEDGAIFSAPFPHYIWLAPPFTSLTPDISGSLSENVEIIWEERTGRQKLSTVIVHVNRPACICIQRDADRKNEGVYKCVRSPTSFPSDTEIYDDPLPLYRLWKLQCTLFCSPQPQPKSDVLLLPRLTFISHQYNLGADGFTGPRATLSTIH